MVQIQAVLAPRQQFTALFGQPDAYGTDGTPPVVRLTVVGVDPMIIGAGAGPPGAPCTLPERSGLTAGHGDQPVRYGGVGPDAVMCVGVGDPGPWRVSVTGGGQGVLRSTSMSSWWTATTREPRCRRAGPGRTGRPVGTGGERLGGARRGRAPGPWSASASGRCGNRNADAISGERTRAPSAGSRVPRNSVHGEDRSAQRWWQAGPSTRRRPPPRERGNGSVRGLHDAAVAPRPPGAGSRARPPCSLDWPNPPAGPAAASHGAWSDVRRVRRPAPGGRAVAPSIRVRRDGIRTRHPCWTHPQDAPGRGGIGHGSR